MAGLNFGALIGAYKPNPLQQLAEAASQFPQQQQQAQLDKLAVKNAQQQIQTGDQQNKMNEFTLQQQKQQALQQQWDMAGNMIKARPKYAQDPNMIAKVTGLAESLGMPSPLDENGHVDASLWQQPFDSLDPKMQEQIRNDALERQPGQQRDAILAGYSGVPDELRTAPQSFTAKNEAALMRAKAAGLKVQDEAQWNTARAKYMTAKTNFINGTADAQDQLILARASQARADAQAVVTRASAAMLQAQAAMKRAQNGFGRARLGGNYGTQVMRSTRAQIEAARTTVTDQISVVQHSIQTLSSQSDDPASDPQINALQNQLQQLQTQKIQLDQSYSDAVDYLTNNTGLVTSLQGQSGKQVQSVVDASKKRDPYTVGAVYGGRDKDGNTVYKRYLGNGQWQPINQ